jgi:hypothetical protein
MINFKQLQKEYKTMGRIAQVQQSTDFRMKNGCKA